MRSTTRPIPWSGALLLLALLAATAPALGQVWSRVTWPDSGWSQIASSADGTTMVAAAAYGANIELPGPILISTNSGRTWAQSPVPETFFGGVACSADGTIMVTATSEDVYGLPGPIYTSTNSGTTWKEFGALTTNYWYGQPMTAYQFGELTFTACSADGSLLAAAVNEIGGMWLSKDGGPWYYTSPTNYPLFSLAISADGSKLLAYPFPVAAAGPYWISTNSGGTWLPAAIPGGFTEIASSADGTLSVASIYETNRPGGIYISTNGWATSSITGVTGTAGGWWVALASLAPGGRLLPFSIDGGIHLTMGTGTAWTLVPAANENWSSVACSADGSKFAATSATGIYTWPSAPALTLSPLPSTNTLLLSWPATVPSLGLQQTSDLTGTNWTATTNATTTTNGLMQAAVPVSGGNMFFRLGRE